MEPKQRPNYLLFFVFAVILFESVFFLHGNRKWEAVFLAEEKNKEVIQSALDDARLEAKAVSVYDFTSKEKIYGRNDDVAMPIASLVKTMLVAVAVNAIGGESSISISQAAILEQGDYGFFVGEKFAVRDLARLTLVGSSNDGSYALAENTSGILEKMNKKAQKIGMTRAMFSNYTGLDVSDGLSFAPSSLASAEDVNQMSYYASRGNSEIFSATVLPEITVVSESGYAHTIKNTNIILGKIPGIIFSKTGYTPLAGGNLSIIYKNQYGREIAVAVLGSTFDGRFKDVENIVNLLYNLDYGSSNRRN